MRGAASLSVPRRVMASRTKIRLSGCLRASPKSPSDPAMISNATWSRWILDAPSSRGKPEKGSSQASSNSPPAGVFGPKIESPVEGSHRHATRMPVVRHGRDVVVGMGDRHARSAGHRVDEPTARSTMCQDCFPVIIEDHVDKRSAPIQLIGTPDFPILFDIDLPQESIMLRVYND